MGSPEEAQAVVDKYGTCVIAGADVKVELVGNNGDEHGKMNVLIPGAQQ